eukprot:GHVP01010022.1.p1 GENE.GHVP01010022.1~~GHVP01010022.1.p1  ORF type:complete len:303 (+),score=44.09 GHVP01010022.1:60-968(+)
MISSVARLLLVIDDFSNILLGRNPRLCDFGGACVLGFEKFDWEAFSDGYAAPERFFSSGRNVGLKEDLWSVGVLICELFSTRESKHFLEYEPIAPELKELDKKLLREASKEVKEAERKKRKMRHFLVTKQYLDLVGTVDPNLLGKHKIDLDSEIKVEMIKPRECKIRERLDACGVPKQIKDILASMVFKIAKSKRSTPLAVARELDFIRQGAGYGPSPYLGVQYQVPLAASLNSVWKNKDDFSVMKSSEDSRYKTLLLLPPVLVGVGLLTFGLLNIFWNLDTKRTIYDAASSLFSINLPLAD